MMKRIHSKSDNIEFISNDNANEVVNELFKSLLSGYQVGLETSMRGRNFIFDSVQLLYYKCLKLNSERGGSYIDSSGLDKKEKSNTKSREYR